MNLSLIIPAHNEEKYLGACLGHILKYATDDLLEIIVVDNASTDRTAEVAASFPKVRVVHEPNKGLLYARQRGLVEAKGELLAYVDADTEISEHWFDVLSKEFAHRPQLVCLSGPGYYQQASRVENFVTWVYWNVLGYAVYKLVGYMAYGANFAATKKALERIGGFDTNISFYGEDTDIARRLSRVGKVVFSGKFFVYSSPRRAEEEGLIRTVSTYMLNYAWIVLFKKPFTKKYEDHR